MTCDPAAASRGTLREAKRLRLRTASCSSSSSQPICRSPPTCGTCQTPITPTSSSFQRRVSAPHPTPLCPPVCEATECSATVTCCLRSACLSRVQHQGSAPHPGRLLQRPVAVRRAWRVLRNFPRLPATSLAFLSHFPRLPVAFPSPSCRITACTRPTCFTNPQPSVTAHFVIRFERFVCAPWSSP